MLAPRFQIGIPYFLKLCPGTLAKLAIWKKGKIWRMYLFYVLIFFKNRDTIQWGFLTPAASIQLLMLGFSPWYMFHGNLQHHRKLSNKPLKLNSAKYKMHAPRIWTDLISTDSILTGNTSRQLTILGFSPWYMLHENLQHHHKLSNKPMKLNSAKYKMRAPRIWNLFDKYRLDFWQLLHHYSQ